MTTADFIPAELAISGMLNKRQSLSSADVIDAVMLSRLSSAGRYLQYQAPIMPTLVLKMISLTKHS
jgi:hypothetical protein